MAVFVIVAESRRNRKRHRLGLRGFAQHLAGHLRAVAAMRKNVWNGGSHSVLALHDLAHLLRKELVRNHTFSVGPEQLLHLKVFGRYQVVSCPQSYGWVVERSLVLRPLAEIREKPKSPNSGPHTALHSGRKISDDAALAGGRGGGINRPTDFENSGS